MADRNATAFRPASEGRPYPFPVAAGAPAYHVAENDRQYKAEIRGEEWPREIKRIELRALRTAASGQIGRLYQLANLLLQPEAVDRGAGELERYGREVRQAASILEDAIHGIVDPLTEEPDSDDCDAE